MKGPELTFGNNIYKIFYTKGVILGKDRKTEVFSSTQTSGGGGSYYQGTGHTNPVSVTSTTSTSIQDDIFIKEDDGKERVISLYDVNIPCREGNEIFAAWIIKNSNEKGQYVMVRNYTTDMTKYIDKEITDVLSIAHNWSDTQKSLFGLGFYGLNFILIILALINFFVASKFYAILAISAIVVLAYYSRKVNKEIKDNMIVIKKELERLSDQKK